MRSKHRHILESQVSYNFSFDFLKNLACLILRVSGQTSYTSSRAKREAKRTRSRGTSRSRIWWRVTALSPARGPSTPLRSQAHFTSLGMTREHRTPEDPDSLEYLQVRELQHKALPSELRKIDHGLCFVTTSSYLQHPAFSERIVNDTSPLADPITFDLRVIR